MNRYLERAENYTRLWMLTLILELPPNEIQQWQPLVVITGVGIVSMLNSSRKVIYFFFLRKRNQLNLQLYFKCKRKCTCRETEITKEVWEQINALYFFSERRSRKKTMFRCKY
jgi:uncharacterized alpha-E superfamily protein